MIEAPGFCFAPASRRTWHSWRSGFREVRTTGWGRTPDGGFFGGGALAAYVGEALDRGDEFERLLQGLDGNFALVCHAPEQVWLAVDGVRSIPLIYRVEGQQLTVSDSGMSLVGSQEAVDSASLVEFSAAGYVTGPYTLYSQLRGLQAGELLGWRAQGASLETRRYHRFVCRYDATESADALAAEFDQIMLGVFRNLLEEIDGRQVVVPLSGGLDSRLIVSMLKRCGYDNVLCYSYGKPGNRESTVSRQIAEQLGYPWFFSEYTASRWRRELRSERMGQFWDATWNAVSYPHIEDFPALHDLRSHAGFAEEVVFFPGHTGDFISGGHLWTVFTPTYRFEPGLLARSLRDKHYALWGDALRDGEVQATLRQRMDQTLDWLTITTEADVAAGYEFWEWQERQAKYIINAVRSYDFFGHDWRIPLWDRRVMAFWERVPLHWKLDKYLYKLSLSQHDPCGVYRELEVGSPRDLSRLVQPPSPPCRRRDLLDWLERVPGLSGVIRRSRQMQYHYLAYQRDPLDLCRAGGPGYFLTEMSKRSGLSLLVRSFLRRQQLLYAPERSD